MTSAVTGFLLKYQKDKSRWSHPGSRPPSSGSDFTTTYVALRGLAVYGTEGQQEQITARHEQVRKWVLDTKPKDTEDHVFRLRSLRYLDVDEAVTRDATTALLALQRDDGGWAQKPDMTSDAYATGSVLVALLRSGVASDSKHVARGIRHLLSTQKDDGSWHVVTRARPFQKYFESGFPHGKDQFISISGTSWATLAILLTLPESVETTAEVSDR